MTHGIRFTPWPLVAVFLAWTSSLCVMGQPTIDPQSSSDAANQLSARIQVLLPDGSRAANAMVHLYDVFTMSTRTVTTDARGHAVLHDQFLGGLRLHVSSDDGRSQAVLIVPDSVVRSLVMRPITIQLEPAREHQIVVTANGQPVDGAHVAVQASVGLQTAVTQNGGVATLWYPHSERIGTVVAWHPKLGVNGARYRGTTEPGETTELALLKPKAHTIRVVDNRGEPVVGCLITANVRTTNSDWIVPRLINAARAKTDANGDVRFDWFPAEDLKYVDVELLDDRWKEDDTNRDETHLGITTVSVRKEFRVKGRVVFPEEIDATGLLVTGFGFGIGSAGDLPRARLRKVGSFSMRVPAGHGFVIGLSDLDWASDLWTGMIVPVEGAAQNEIVLQAYPATPLKVRVTRGTSRDPVADAYVSASRRGRVEWTTETGESRTGRAGVRSWTRSDEEGLAQTSVGLGEVELRISSGDWSEERTIQVASREPVNIDFHRAWAGNRIVRARPSVDGTNYVPSGEAVALAWTKRSPQVDKIHAAGISEDGQIEVEFDEEELSVLLLDRKQHRSGFAEVGVDDEVVDLPMLENASYSGTLVDRRDGSPLVDRTVRIVSDSSFLDVVEPTQTDDQGHFVFSDVAAGVPLRLAVKNEPGRPEYFLFDSERLFEPRERRTDDVARASLMDGNRAVPDEQPKRSIAERFEVATADARAMDMNTIVMIEGDHSSTVKHVAGRLRNHDDVEAISRYVVVLVTADQVKQADESFAAVNWPKPDPGEVVMVVPSNDEKESATLRLECSNIKAAFQSGSTFIERHMPQARDGREKLEEAQRNAAQSDRMVWVIAGGPRCGPCFRLARWIETHQDVLTKDFLIVKLTASLDEHWDEICEEIGGSGHGIPFHVLMSPEGEVAWTSEGPLGNIGMPSSVEGIRYFQTMLQAARQRMTPSEIRQLIDSLSEQD